MKIEDLREEIKTAMKNGNKECRDILRQVNEYIKNKEINEKIKATEETVDAAIKKIMKQLEEEYEAAKTAATNPERTEKLKNQIEILKGYMPKIISGEELKELVEKTAAEIGATSKKQMGAVMKKLGEITGGNFDKKAASDILKDKLE